MKLNTQFAQIMRASTLLILVALLLNGCGSDEESNETVRVAILMGGDNRQALVDGVQAGLADLGYADGEQIAYEIHHAGGDNTALPDLAVKIVDSNPDLIISAGGLETDAAHAATAGADIPVVFTGVSSSVDRGVVASLQSSGNNLTGVDTAYTELSGKRLEIFNYMMPEIKNVAVINMPDITPSVKSLESVQAVASGLGINVLVFTIGPERDFAAAARDIVASEAQALFLFPVSPVQQAMAEWLYPALSQKGIPILGVFSSDLERGAFAFYGGDQFLMGRQAARLADKVLKGAQPQDIPVEMPADLQVIINRTVVEALGLSLSDEAWGMADSIVEIPAP